MWWPTRRKNSPPRSRKRSSNGAKLSERPTSGRIKRSAWPNTVPAIPQFRRGCHCRDGCGSVASLLRDLAGRLSPHKLVGEQAVVGFQLLLRLEQPGFDIEQFRIFEPGLAHGQRARSDLADVLE